MPHVVIVICDALRPDAVTRAQMPNLSRFRDRHMAFARHRAIFPSDTRANAAAFVTGAFCNRHGINGNGFMIETTGHRRLLDTGSVKALIEAQAALGGKLFRVATLADVLSAQKRRMAIISSASSGTTHLLHMTTRNTSNDHFCLSCHDRTLSTPGKLLDEIEADLGPAPPEDLPDIGALTYGLSAFLAHTWPKVRPDVALFWFNEPDVSYHAHGVSGSATELMMSALDNELGRLFDWWYAEGLHQDVQLIVASDHGQVTVDRPIDVIGALQAGGFDACGATDDEGAFQVIGGGFGQIYARDPRRLADLGHFLQDQPWTGLTFCRASDRDMPLQGMLAARSVMYDNARTPDITFTFRSNATARGAAGAYASSNPNAGMHGGLSRDEMSAFLAAGGSRFGSQAIQSLPSCTVDFLPTILDCLNLPCDRSTQGRSLCQGDAPAVACYEDYLEASTASYRQFLRRFHVGDHLYLDHGWTD